MSRIAEIIDDLRQNHAAIERLESNIAKNPDADGLTLTMASLLKRRQNLEQQFEEQTSYNFVEIVNYRIIPDDVERLPLRAVTGALDRFQAAISTLFDARRTGPKKRARLSGDALAQSEFEFAYTYAGSLGVVLTIPNERLLIGESDLDAAVEMFFSAAKVQARDGIVQLAEQAGIPAVRRLYEWSVAHSQYGLSADIQWRRQDQIRSRVSVQLPALKRLQEIIEETSDVSEDPVEISGVLVGLDTTLKTFHIIVPHGEDIKGSWADDFSYSADHRLNERYSASLLKKSVTYYAYEKEEVTWSLVGLRHIQSETK